MEKSFQKNSLFLKIDLNFKLGEPELEQVPQMNLQSKEIPKLKNFV